MKIYLELFRTAPEIGGVQGDVDGDVSHQCNALLAGVCTEPVPLAVKLVLQELVEVDLLCQRPTSPRQRLRLPPLEFRRPLRPSPTAKVPLQRHKQGVVLQPVRFGVTERPEICRWSHSESFIRLPQNRQPLPVQQSKIHLIRTRTPGDFIHFRLGQKPVLNQKIQVNEIGIPSKGGEGLIG